jgi:hypothetical protein
MLPLPGDVHGGAAAAAATAALLPRWRWRQTFYKITAVAVRQRQVFKNSSRQRRGSGRFFFEDIEKLHEFDRISVFKSETA